MSEKLKLQTLVNALEMHVRAINATLSDLGTLKDVEVEVGTIDVTTFAHNSSSVIGLTYRVTRVTYIGASGDKS